MRISLISIALGCTFLTACALSAQAPPSFSADHGPTGVIVGVNLTGSLVTIDGATFDEHTFEGRGREGGGGMHATLGYAFSPSIALLLHAGGVVLNEDAERVLGGVDLALRYSFPSTPRSAVPYLEMAVGGFALEDASEGGGAELAGGSLSVAGGLNIFLNRQVAVNADFRYNMGMFSTVSLRKRTIADDASMGFGSTRVNVGFNWYPMAR